MATATASMNGTARKPTTNTNTRSIARFTRCGNGDKSRGKSGKGGGYSLARPADQIPLREIFESAIGQINIVDCVMQPDFCLKSDFCECRSLYALINKKITSVLDSLYLSDMIDNDQLEQAMHIHHHTGAQVGAALIQIGALSDEDLESGLELQRQLKFIAGLPKNVAAG